jgi:hypothetical protein
MSAFKLTIHSTGIGTCPLSGREGDGLTVTFEDGTVKETFLSWKGFRQLLGLKATQTSKPEVKPAVPVTAVPAK